MRTEATDNWFGVVDRFAASSLRMIFVGQRGCKRILLIRRFRRFGVICFCKNPLIALYNNNEILSIIRYSTGNQCKSIKLGAICSYFLVNVTIRAALFVN